MAKFKVGDPVQRDSWAHQSAFGEIVVPEPDKGGWVITRRDGFYEVIHESQLHPVPNRTKE